MSSTGNRNIPSAPVQRWNAQTVSVQCPFCTNIHTHGWSTYSCIMRAPHCDNHPATSYPSYRFVYPFSTHEGTVAYEIDKSAGCYVALGAKAIARDVEPLEEMLNGLNLDVDRKTWDQSTEMITIGMEDETFWRLHQVFGGEDTFILKRLDHVVSRMITHGDSKYVEDFILTSPEAKLLLLGTNQHGRSALHLAACEKYPAVVKLLLDHGAKPNARDKDGRTPLMEAALWGRIDNINYLLGHGTNRKLRDIHGYQAADLAKSSSRNDEERYQRSGGEVQVYRENKFIADRDRRVIVELLKDSEESLGRAVSTLDRGFETHSFRNTGRGTIELIAPIAEYPVPKEWKTIASLHRPSNFPPISAMSGWGHGETTITVSGKEWTAEVMNISTNVGHQLKRDSQKDQGKAGQHFASHAEKQLVAYFISKHVLIKTADKDLLQQAKPPVLLTQATILVSSPLCGDCLQFIKTVNVTLGLKLSVLDRSEESSRGKRN